MTPDEALWVREHAWLPFMRRQLWHVAGTGYSYDAAVAAAVCECMAGVCWHCSQGDHKHCHRDMIRPRPEWWIQNRPLDFIKPTAVWLADRECRPLCPCVCPPEPAAEPVQLDLFAEVA